MEPCCVCVCVYECECKTMKVNRTRQPWEYAEVIKEHVKPRSLYHTGCQQRFFTSIPSLLTCLKKLIGSESWSSSTKGALFPIRILMTRAQQFSVSWLFWWNSYSCMCAVFFYILNFQDLFCKVLESLIYLIHYFSAKQNLNYLKYNDFVITTTGLVLPKVCAVILKYFFQMLIIIYFIYFPCIFVFSS